MVNGRSAGAPGGACINLTPDHGVAAQNTPSPHIVDLSEFYNDSMANNMTNNSFYYYPETMYSSKL